MLELAEIARLLRSPRSVNLALYKEQLAEHKEQAVERGDQIEAKHIWCLEQVIEAHSTYQAASSDLKAEKFYDAWCKLERVEITLSFLRRHFRESWSAYDLDFLDEYTVKWQSLFPYKLFSSTELVKEIICCSICGEKIGPRTDCGHETGEIYDGEMCCRVVEKCDLVAISLVGNPANKYAVAFAVDPVTKERRDQYNYAVVDFAAKALDSPYSRWDYTKTMRRQPHGRYSETGRNDKCPCGSGKKYKRCCLRETGVLSPHIQFQFEEPPPRGTPSLSYSSEWRALPPT